MSDLILTEFTDGIPTPQSSVEVLPSRVRPRPQAAHEDAAASRHADAGVGDEVTVLLPA
jgi:hypothetical protein